MGMFKIITGFRTLEGDFEEGKTLSIPQKSAEEGLKNGWINPVKTPPKNKAMKPRKNK